MCLTPTIKPYRSAIEFVYLLLFSHFIWGIAIEEDRKSGIISIFGKNFTPGFFQKICMQLTDVIAWFVQLFPNTQNLIVNGYRLYFPDGNMRISIIWSCIGIKQLFAFCCIIIFYRCFPVQKYHWNKLWYIPIGCTILTIYNIIRIGMITLLTHHHPEQFSFLHDGIFRYVYYSIVFILWLIWEEILVKKLDI